MSHSSRVVVVIFAKYPEPGLVKTRLAQSEKSGESGEFGLSVEQASWLYRAFLQDYVTRFAQMTAVWQIFFCLRSATQYDAFCREIGQDKIQVILEPEWQGRAAHSIGEAMSFTIRDCLSRGWDKAIILGSDLPHLPLSLIEEAVALLDIHPLVLGNDGGGCYLVAASDTPTVLEDPSIVWSQGTDFAAICQTQQTMGRSVGILSQICRDIDRLEDLRGLCRDLQEGLVFPESLPHTVALLRDWGWISPDLR